MPDEIEKKELVVIDNSNGAALTINTEDLNKESLDILNRAIAETDIEKSKDLTYLFNLNQNKKTMVRIDKLSRLMDVITEQAIERFSNPDEITTDEMLKGMKIVQDSIERSQNQISGVNAQQPLIQINQQTNEVNVGDGANLNRESRDKVKRAVMDILKGISTPSGPVIINTQEAKQEDEENYGN